MQNDPSNEPAFQVFLTAHPQILDPLAIRVWPQPNLFGFKEPDYIVQRADGTYMVVEIECPAKGLVTTGGHLTADVTHAESQAADYRRYLIKHFSEMEKHFIEFQEPDCLVVIGLERTLKKSQKQALSDANNNRNHIRIVGFDWLLNRARAIAHNITQPTVELISLRAT
ncbi:Shedu anti-phage system protein SduA domain-containing protein [Azospirillum sp. CT11-132]|uniref:Shedu anti-phage system protein SduA domain-containing protein n=1 Tax=Azospirillum sp. CT11-132 TaxID=3396317 RepID=UPI0039A5A8B4